MRAFGPTTILRNTRIYRVFRGFPREFDEHLARPKVFHSCGRGAFGPTEASILPDDPEHLTRRAEHLARPRYENYSLRELILNGL
ncbi:hypothetical protein SAMN05443244_4008 [Terriglobus roseus]|jgi:hypothetical protein|uniref:Uncharacterized protein n=1 Tax=Terriglobus roseus TaxID=392734 RepID=A0A1H4W3V6_9BACT|nr:hypothetical protein SAMN05443244_4008 [Terriglobus roseus]